VVQRGAVPSSRLPKKVLTPFDKHVLSDVEGSPLMRYGQTHPPGLPSWCERMMGEALPSVSRCGDSTAIRSRPIQFEQTRELVRARLVPMPPRWAARMLGCSGGRFPSAVQSSAAQGTAPWLHAQWRGKEESEEGTTAWCPPRIWAGGGREHSTTALAARVWRLMRAVFQIPACHPNRCPHAPTVKLRWPD
jgi:hypothetical protein